MQKKIWFIKVDGKKEGPYSLQELRSDPRVTPDTLVWTEGFKDWIEARHVPELKSLFEDEETEELGDRFKVKTVPQEDSTLVIEGSNYPFLFFWIIVILLVVLAYVFF